MRQKIACGALALVLGMAPLRAEEPGAAFLAITPSVRADAMGGVAALSLGAEAVGLNPALAVPFREKSQVYATLAQMEAESTYTHLAYVTAAGKSRVGWGLAVTHARAEGETGYDASGAPTGRDTSAQDTAVTATLSTRMGRGMRLGVAGRCFWSDLAGYSAEPSWAVDAGLSLTRNKILYSASVNNLGPGQTFIEQTDPLPALLRIEMAWQPGALAAVVGLQQDLARDGTRLAAGAEYRWNPLFLRAGINTRLGGPSDLAGEDDSLSQRLLDSASVGIGLDLSGALRLDYALDQGSVDNDLQHRVGFTWAMGKGPAAVVDVPPKSQTPTKRPVSKPKIRN